MSEDVAPAGEPSLVAVLAAYENVRVALAADDTTALPGTTKQLATAAQSAKPAPHVGDIQASAAKLASAGANLEAARAAFGEVSRHVVALLVAEKSLAQGKHVFECPMVSGYRKWVQPTDDLENPYMGKQMLACGGASSWE